jgi:hypothetical protein
MEQNFSREKAGMTTRVAPMYMDWWMSNVRPWNIDVSWGGEGRGGERAMYVDVEEGEEGDGFVALVVFSSFPAQVRPFDDCVHHCV